MRTALVLGTPDDLRAELGCHCPGTCLSCPQSVPSTGQGLNHCHVLLTGLHAWCLQGAGSLLGAETLPPMSLPACSIPRRVSGLRKHSRPRGLSDQCRKKPEWQPLTSWAALVFSHSPTLCLHLTGEEGGPSSPRFCCRPPGALQYCLGPLYAGLCAFSCHCPGDNLEPGLRSTERALRLNHDRRGCRAGDGVARLCPALPESAELTWAGALGPLKSLGLTRCARGQVTTSRSPSMKDTHHGWQESKARTGAGHL